MKSNNDEVIQANLLEQSTYQNGYSAYVPWSKSIGFKVNTLRQQEHASSQLAEDFLTNLGFTKNNVESEYSIRAFLEPSGTIMLSYANQEDNSHLEKISLPASAPLKLPLDKVLKARRSVRHYTGDKVPLSYLATILRAACGITASDEVDIGNGASASMNFRVSSSAGGIYPIDLYVVALNVENLDQAIYQYNPIEDCLVKLFDKDIVAKLLQSFAITEELISISRSGFIALLAGSAPKSMRKYGNQGLSFTLQEVGSISQNIHLAVTALGMGSVDCASYYLNEMHQTLKMDGVYKHLFHSVIVGISQ
jgi:SagB-type dehydrogenase family enzyme